MEYLGFLASFAMGITLGLMGGGGSILTVPILVYLFSITPTTATGYSLFVVGVTALIGSFIYIRKGDIDLKAGIAFALPSVLGVNISRGLLLPNIPTVIAELDGISITKELLVMAVFAVLMVVASVSMIRVKKESKPMQTSSLIRLTLIAAQGFIVGLIAGFVGAGGGFLIIPVLVFIAALPMRKAVGTSLTIIAFQSLFGFAGDAFRGMTVDWKLLASISVFATMGIFLGSLFAHKIKEQNLKSTFGWFVLVMGLTILVEQSSHIFSK